MKNSDQVDSSPENNSDKTSQAPQKQTPSKSVSLLAQLTTLAWNLAFPIVGGVLLGNYLDRRFESELTWTLSLLVLGVMASFSNLYTLYKEHGLQPLKNGKKNSGRKEPTDDVD